MQRIVTLTPPQFSADQIQEKIVCIRAHRERIFQVFPQVCDGKQIFHNYGHGGAGWTFLFGCVPESIRQFEAACAENSALHTKPICVIGAGCYGLLTAIMLARKGHAVRIVAKETEHIPSTNAAGFFFPRARKSSTPEERATFLARGVESYATYLDIIRGTHPFITKGPKLIPAYFDPAIDPGFAPYIDNGLMQKPENVIIDFDNGKQYQAVEYMKVFVNPAVLMQELHRVVRELNIPIIRTEIETFGDIDESIIFNCAGLGAKKLTGDPRIIPVQGHLITLKNQPDVNALQYIINTKVPMLSAKGYMKDELIYFAPKNSGILGISFVRGQDSLTANHHEFDRLLERCHDYFGKMNHI